MCQAPIALPIALSLGVCAMCAHAAPPKLSPLALLQLDLRSEDVAIVSPQSQVYQDIAAGLCAELVEATGRTPAIVVDTVMPEELGKGPVIVLGNVMECRLARLLYVQAYDLTDYSWPSPGGYVVRTIRDPFGTGAHAIIVGGSDIEGVSQAALALGHIARQRGPVLGYVNEVKLGKWASEIQGYADGLLNGDDEFWKRSGTSGSWDYQIKIAQAAIGYLRTGDEAYLEPFRRELRYWFDHDVHNPSSEAPQMLHGFVNTLLIPWDLVRDHPSFDEDERRRIDEGFLYVYMSSEGPGRIGGHSKLRRIRDNHGTRTGLDAFFGGRYFLRRYELAQAREWLEIAEGYFGPQMQSAKPVEDSWGHQWAASLFNTAVYALAAGHDDYFDSAAFRLAADRALIAHPSGGAPRAYMSACALATGDTGYLIGFGDAEALAERSAAMAGHGDEYLRSFCTGQIIRPRDDLQGVAVAPVDAMWYETIDEAGFNPGGLFADGVPLEECFDKISIREGWGADEFYLLFDGISGGHHSYQDGNCVVHLREGQATWLSSGYNPSGSMTVRAQNGVFLALDGAGPGRLHRYARKLYAGQAGGYLGVAAAFEGVGQVDWHRHVLRKCGAWTLVIDRAVPTQEGEVLAERHWHPRGEVSALGAGLVAKQSIDGRARCLHLQSAGLPVEGMSGTTDRRELVRARANPDRPVEMATLLHVNGEATRAEYELVQTTVGWRIDGPDGSEFVVLAAGDAQRVAVVTRAGVATIGAAPDGSIPGYETAVSSGPAAIASTLPLTPQYPVRALPWRTFRVSQEPVTACAIGPDGFMAAGDRAGQLAILSRDGQRIGEANMPSGILSLHFADGNLFVGEERGALTCLRPDGTQVWQVAIPYVPMAWPYWSEERSRIREITSADITGDGRHEILISNSDRRVYAFSAAGEQLWKTPVEWGIFTAMTAVEDEDGFALMGGTSRPSIHGRCIVLGEDGQRVAYITRTDLVSWSVPSQFRDMRVADLDGDGTQEIINGIDTNCRQLVVYRRDGSVMWDADVAGAAQAVAVADVQGQAAVLCSSVCGYVSGYEGATGKRLWAAYVGEPTSLVAPLSPDSSIALSSSGKAFTIDGRAEVTGVDELGSPVTAFLRPGDHRAGNDVAVGTADGRLLVLPTRESR